MRSIFISNSTFDGAICRSIVTATSQLLAIDSKAVMADEYYTPDTYIRQAIKERYEAIYILGVKISDKIADELSEAKREGTIKDVQMYYSGSSGIYREWSHDIRSLVSEILVTDLKNISAGIIKNFNMLIAASKRYNEDPENRSETGYMGYLFELYRTHTPEEFSSEIVNMITKENCFEDDSVKDEKAPVYIHYTHMDLDAAGCAIILDVCNKLGGPKYEHRFCRNPSDCSDKIKEFLHNEMKEGVEYNILITDISIKDENVAAELDRAFREGKIANLQMYDHHPTALWTDVYPWCTVLTECKAGNIVYKTCGAELLYSQFDSAVRTLVSNPIVNGMLNPFVGIIRLYDTYDWKNEGDYGRIAYNHNTIFNKYGMSKYIETMVERIINKEDPRDFTEEELALIKEEDDRFEEYLQICRERLCKCSANCDQYGRRITYGALFCNRYTSEIGNRLSTENTDLDFILMVNIEKEKVEIRTAKDDFDTSIFAKLNGGGGHPKASGFPLTRSLMKDFVGNGCSALKK